MNRDEALERAVVRERTLIHARQVEQKWRDHAVVMAGLQIGFGLWTLTNAMKATPAPSYLWRTLSAVYGGLFLGMGIATAKLVHMTDGLKVGDEPIHVNMGWLSLGTSTVYTPGKCDGSDVQSPSVTTLTHECSAMDAWQEIPGEFRTCNRNACDEDD